MRIVSGLYKSRPIKAVPSKETRPTTDRVREAWASTLTSLTPCQELDGLTILDCFAGSGALGLELLSRGAKSCLFVERNKRALATLRTNIASLEIEHHKAIVCSADSLSPALLRCAESEEAFDIVVLDPPYALASEAISGLLQRLDEACLLKEGSLISYEHAAGRDLSTDILSLQRSEPTREASSCVKLELEAVKHKTYGTTSIDFYRCYHSLGTGSASMVSS